MKLLAIIDSTELYGKERANIQVARVIKEHGNDVRILINNEAKGSVRSELSAFDTTEIPFPRNISGRNRVLKYIYRFLKTQVSFYSVMKKDEPDFLLIPTEIALTYLLLPLLLLKVKLIFRCGDSPLTYRKRHSILCKPYYLLWKHIILPRINIIVCNAKFIQKQLADSGRKQNKNDRLIYNYPPIRYCQTDDIKYDNVATGSLKVGFMGRIVEDKGIRELISATIKANIAGYDVECFIGGSINSDSEYTKELLTIIDENPQYANRIHLLGNINDIEKFYSAIDIIAVPSIYEEPMANVVTEAKLCHKLSVIYNLGGMPEIITHMKDGYICHETSIEALTQALCYYADNTEEVKRQGEEAYQSIEYLGLKKEIFERKWLSVIDNIR